MRSLLLKNVLTRGVTTPITMLAGLLSAWIAVGHLGVDMYTAILIVTGLAQLMPFVDMGVGAAVISTLGGRKDESGAAFQVLVSAQRVLALAALVIIAIAATLSAIQIWPLLLGGGVTALPNANLYVLAFFSVFATYVFMQLGYRVLTGIGLNHLTSVLVGSANLLSLGMFAFGAAINAPPIWFLLSPTTASVCLALVANLIAGRRSGHHYIAVLASLPRVARLPQRSLRSTAGPMVIILIALPTLIFSHRLILSHVASMDSLVEYTLASQIYAPAWAAASGALIALWPIFSASRQEGVDARNVLGRAVSYVISGALLASIVLVLVLPWATGVIGHGSGAATPQLALAFATLLFVQVSFYPIGVYLTRPKELTFQAGLAVVMLLFGLPLSVAFAEAVGAPGPVWASTLAILAFQVLPSLIYLHRIHRKENRVP